MTALKRLIFLFGIVIFFYYVSSSSSFPLKGKPFFSNSPTPSDNLPTVLGEQTKNANCVAVNGFPDSACTPGAIFPDATRAQICVYGYTKTVRDVPLALKREVYDEYGVIYHHSGEYEVDHLISLELGGSNNISNLWPEAAAPIPGFHEKDQVENYLHDLVCNGEIPLSEAQKKISANWLSVYQNMPKNSRY